MTKCQLLKEISELFLPRSDEERKYEPELFLPYSRNSSDTLTFLVKIYLGLTLRTFWEEQLEYFNFALYLVIFRAKQ